MKNKQPPKVVAEAPVEKDIRKYIEDRKSRRDPFMRAIDCAVALEYYGDLWKKAAGHYPSPDRIHQEPSRKAAFLDVVSRIKAYQEVSDRALRELLQYVEFAKP